MPGTVRLHRVFAAKPEKVNRAVIEPDAMANWHLPNGCTGTVHHMTPEVGGSCRISLRNFTTGHGHAFGCQYVELVSNARLCYIGQFEDLNLPGEIRVTVTLKKVSVGTVVTIVEDALPVEACYLGWQESLRNLAISSCVNSRITTRSTRLASSSLRATIDHE